MTFEEIRKLTIIALFADDLLFEQLVLKGGNAMSLVLGLSNRVSLDLDFSMATDFDDLAEIQARIERTLISRFTVAGLVPFDVKLVAKPSTQSSLSWWGGYELNFKLTDEERHRKIGADQDRLRREAIVVGPDQKRIFTVDFSKCEYTEGKVKQELDHFTIYVYSPAMIAVEKLRALCQQMQEYIPTGKIKRARARDFFDIFTIVTKTGLRFQDSEVTQLLDAVFAAKQVPIKLLGKIAEQRDFHRDDWPSVRATVKGRLEEFDYYFDFVLDAIKPLESLWMV